MQFELINNLADADSLCEIGSKVTMIVEKKKKKKVTTTVKKSNNISK